MVYSQSCLIVNINTPRLHKKEHKKRDMYKTWSHKSDVISSWDMLAVTLTDLESSLCMFIQNLLKIQWVGFIMVMIKYII